MYKIALLIDAENISYKDLPYLRDVLPHYGKIVLTAVYGNWHNPAMQNWHDFAAQRNFKIRHCTHHTTGKNTADMKLIMDAMDVLYRTEVDVICLVSDDADYVPLCEKVREANKAIIGIGHTHAAKAFVDACNHFIYIDKQEDPVAELVESLLADTPDNIRQQSQITPESVIPAPVLQPPPTKAEIVAHKKTLMKAFSVIQSDKQGYITPQQLGTALSGVHPGFKQQYYPRQTLNQFLEHFTDIIDIGVTDGGVRIRLKNPPGEKKPASSKQSGRLRKIIIDAFLDESPSGGWMMLSTLGTTIRKKKPGFDISDYGHSSLTKALESMPDLIKLKVSGGVKSACLIQKQLPIKKLLKLAFIAIPETDNGWVTLSSLGNSLRVVQPGFKPGHYGHATLKKLLNTYPKLVDLRKKSGVDIARLKS